MRRFAEHVAGDLRHALRMIRRMPVLAAVVILSLGVGIGVNVAVFSWMQALVFRPLPGVSNAGGFHLVEPRTEEGSYAGASWLEYQDLRERLPAFRDLLAFRMTPLTVGDAGSPERSYGQFVSANYFSALGVRPAAGRVFRPDDASRPGGEPVIVISHDYWQIKLGGADVLGRTLRVNDRVLTIIGITPEGFQGTVIGLNFDLWVPATLAPVLLGGSRELEDRAVRGYSIMGRLHDRATREDAQVELVAAMRELAGVFPETNATITGEVLPFWQSPRGPQRMMVRALAILQGVLLVLLLAVCGNTANLVLARASARRKEIGVRLALGAGRGRIASLLLAESLVLALAGATLGTFIAIWGTQALRAAPMIGAFPIRFQTSVDVAGLAVAILLGVACGLLFGVAPAAQLARLDPHLALRSGASTSRRSRTRNALMGAQVALALIVLVAGGLFLRSFGETRDIDPGFRRDGVLLAAYDLGGRNLDDAAVGAFAGRLLRALRALPSVEEAAIASSVPLDIHGLPLRSFALEGRARADDAPDRAISNTVTPSYFATMGIPLLAGRDFADLDDATSPPQAIVNEEFVRRYLDRAEPLGRRIESRDRSYVIAGVVRNSVYDAFGEAPKPIIYYSYRDRPSSQGEIHLRTRTGAEGPLAADVRRVVREIDPALPVYDVRTLGEHVEKNLFLKRIPARMFVVLGPLLLVLAAIGIYAVVAYTVAHRTREIGVRLALGATPASVRGSVLKRGIAVSGAGLLVGLLALAPLRALAKPLLYGITPTDPLTIIAVSVVLLGVGAVATWLPARRAAKLDPVRALKWE